MVLKMKNEAISDSSTVWSIFRNGLAVILTGDTCLFVGWMKYSMCVCVFVLRRDSLWASWDQCKIPARRVFCIIKSLWYSSGEQQRNTLRIPDYASAIENKKKLILLTVVFSLKTCNISVTLWKTFKNHFTLSVLYKFHYAFKDTLHVHNRDSKKIYQMCYFQNRGSVIFSATVTEPFQNKFYIHTQRLCFADVCSLFVYKLFAHFSHYTVDFKPAFTIPREHKPSC